MMNRACYEFLAGPGFSSDKNRHVRWRDACDLLAKLANRGTPSCNLRGTFEAQYGVAEPTVLAQEPGVLHGTAGGCKQDFWQRMAW